MCGIFGVVAGAQVGLTQQWLLNTVNDLFKLSESRGKEASGLAICGRDTIRVHKGAIPATDLIHSDGYKQAFAESLSRKDSTIGGPLDQPVAIIGHSRLVTNGAMEVHENNQPIIANGLVGVHNGIIVNDAKLWESFPELHRSYEVDTEVILSLIRHFYTSTGSVAEAVRKTFNLIEGTASIGVMFDDANVLVIATNNGSLYTCSNAEGSIHIFASEKYILDRMVKHRHLRGTAGETQVLPVKPGFGCILDVGEATAQAFDLNGSEEIHGLLTSSSFSRTIVDTRTNGHQVSPEGPRLAAPTAIPASIYRRFSIDTEAIKSLRRCTKCVLPETMPFIEFDEHGVCNYCRNYRKIEVLGHDALMEAIDPYRCEDGEPDCLVMFSGGRDSSFGLHYVKNVLKMNPVTYTYDWGMVTDLARRNSARLCGRLGIENILVSADITRKRENIRKNVTAWLKRPDLGTVPLFMAGDKQYFYYANRLRRQAGIQIVILCENLLEATGFKSGFCGVPPSVGASHAYTVSLRDKVRLAAYYAKEYLLNPAYVNSSVLDTLGAFASYYIMPHEYLNLFSYVRWDEEKIIPTLVGEYDWELATDTRTTWRIGDGTASFYNYIYYCIGGFTENDTFRSNQIREGMLSREQALAAVCDDNQPRFESIQWYCDTIGIDMETALERINSAQKLYQWQFPNARGHGTVLDDRGRTDGI